MTFAAGTKLRVGELNQALAVLVRSTADVSRTSSTTMIDATGLTVPLAANATYLLDGYLAYLAGATTGDLRVALTVPTSTTGHWALFAADLNAVDAGGNVITRRLETFGDANFLTAGGSNYILPGVMCTLRAYIATGSTAGNLQVRFAQNTTSTTATTIKAGSWLRAQRVA